ncbi:MAG: PrsW family glutamic-type intramembrane protease [Candidatus Heimdallarchaeota archaeon]
MGIEQYVQDKIIITTHKPDEKEKLFFLISGIIISVPFTLFIGTLTEPLCAILPRFLAALCSVALFTPLIEEYAKAYPMFYRHGETERSLFTLGFLVGLGFGLSEFVLYILVIRASLPIRLPGLFFHAASTSTTTYGIATRRTIQFYLIAVVLHAMYNFSAFFSSFWYISGAIVVIITYFLAWHFYRKTSVRSID